MKIKQAKVRSFMLLELLLIAAVISVFAYFLAKVYLKNLFPSDKENQQFISQQYISPQSITSQSIHSQSINPQHTNADKYNSVIGSVKDDVKNMNRQMNDLQKQLQKM